MRVISFFVCVVGAAIAFASAAAELPVPNTEAARIERAVEAYAVKLRVDSEKARDAAVANRAAALLEDPATPVLGNRNGDVAIVMFFDYACPFCKAAEPRLLQLLKDDKGVKLILKEFPILTAESRLAAKASLAAARQGKYETFHLGLMAHRGKLEAPMIFEIAAKVGLDVERLRKDMDAPEIADQIIANFNLARPLGVTSTPTFIIGTHLVTEPSAQIDFPKAVAAARAR